MVQAFKVGPDQLDPLLHEAATGRPSYNLDGYLRTRRANVARVAALAEPGDVDVAVVEGGESLFDADDAAVGERGGAAQMAKWLGAPWCSRSTAARRAPASPPSCAATSRWTTSSPSRASC